VVKKAGTPFAGAAVYNLLMDEPKMSRLFTQQAGLKYQKCAVRVARQ